MAQQRLPIVGSDDGTWGDILRQYLQKEHYDTGLDNAANGGHQKITIRPGSATAGTAPLKFSSGTLLTTPEAGAVEFNNDSLYFTQTTSNTRKQIATYDTTGATGDVYYRDASGYFTRLAVGATNTILTVAGGVPTWSATLAGKTLDNTNTVTLKDTNFTLQDNTDTTKQLQFELSGITTATTRTITIPNVSGTMYVSSGTDVSVADGGTGRSTNTTAYGIIAAGTTATGAMQTIAPGTSGQFLKSGGAAALGAFANITAADITGTTAQFNTALSDGDFATLAGTETLTGKTINLSSNTLTGTTAQFNTSLSDGDFATSADILSKADTYASPSGGDVLNNQTLNLHPEDGGFGLMPFVTNDLAYNIERGGTITYTLNGSPITPGSVNNPFYPDVSYTNYAIGAITDTFVITVGMHTDRTWRYTNHVGIVMPGWITAKDVMIEAYDTTAATWRTVATYTNVDPNLSRGIFRGNTATVVPGGNDITQLRFTVTNFISTVNPPRILSIFCINYVSGLLSDPFLPRGGGSLYGTNALPPALSASGGDTDIDLKLASKGAGVVKANNVEVVTISGSQTLTNKTLTTPIVGSFKDTNGNTILSFNPLASANNYITIQNSSNTWVGMSANGAGTNIPIFVYPKGNSAFTVYTATGQTPTIQANGQDANHNLNLTAKGTGVVQVGGVEVTTISASQTLTNKTISGSSNTLSNIPQAAVTNLTTDLAGKASTTHTHTASQISDSTAVGRSVLTAVDATAARTAIGAGTGSGDVTLTGAQTLTNKSLTAPTLSGTTSLGGAIDFTPAAGTILSFNGKAAITRHAGGTSNSIGIGADDTLFLGAGESRATMAANVTSGQETVEIGGDSGVNIHVSTDNWATNWAGKKTTAFTATGITWDGNQVWHAGNDGTGSGLDADTLDGVQAASFATLTGSESLTNKTLTAPVLSGTITGTYTLGGTPTFPSTVVSTTGSQTLTNKTISGSSNTITNLDAAAISTGTLPMARIGIGDYENLVAGSDFETSLYPWSLGAGRSIASDYAHSGTYSYKFSAGAAGASYTGGTIELKEGDRLYCECWVRRDIDYNATDARIRLGAMPGNLNVANLSFHASVFTEVDTWVKKSFITNPYPAGSIGVTPSITMTGLTTGTIWIDDIVIRRVKGTELIPDLDAAKITTGTIPVARGGTGVASLSGVVVGNGTSAFTAVTAPTGTIVGTSDTQTLTNKIISGSSNTLSNIGMSALSTTGTASSSAYLRGDGAWSDLNTLSSSLRANRNLNGGGTITVDVSGNVSWTTRFIVIANGRGSNFSTAGYFDIICPTSGTITGVGGASNKTATAAGIPLAAWEALYYIMPIGSSSTSLAANFRVATYSANMDVPLDWLLICIRNGENGAVTFNNGITLSPGQSLNAIQQSNTNTANTLVRRDASGNFTAGMITATGFTATVATGTAPFTVTSTTAVTNLNADLLDDMHATTANTANTVVARDVNGDFAGRYVNSTYVNMSHSASTRNADTVFYSSTDAYIRKNTAAGFKASLALDNVDNTSDATKNSASATLTNKIISGSSNTFSNIPTSAITGLQNNLPDGNLVIGADFQDDSKWANAAGTQTSAQAVVIGGKSHQIVSTGAGSGTDYFSLTHDGTGTPVEIPLVAERRYVFQVWALKKSTNVGGGNLVLQSFLRKWDGTTTTISSNVSTATIDGVTWNYWEFTHSITSASYRSVQFRLCLDSSVPAGDTFYIGGVSVTDLTGAVSLYVAQTLTNKTLTAPVLNGTITGTYTLGGTPTFPSTVVSTTGVQTLTNKRVTPRIGTITSSATPSINTDSYDQYTITALAANITSVGVTGTPTDGQRLIIRIKDNGSARSIVWGASWRGLGVTLPVVTTASKTIYVGALYNSAESIWDVIAVEQQV